MTGRSHKERQLTPKQEREERRAIRIAAAWLIIAALGILIGGFGQCFE